MAIFGVRPYGPGTPAVSLDTRGTPGVNPYSGRQEGSRKIDPATKDYDIDNTTGCIRGMTNAQQLVYMAVSTTRGTSAMRALGHDLLSIDRITSNFVRRVDATLRAAVQHIVDREVIEVVGTEVHIVRPGVALARLRWRDTETGEENVTEVGKDAAARKPYPPAIYALNYDLVDTAGGTSVTISGTALSSATSCTVGGTSATITANTSTSLTFTMPAKTAGMYNVQVVTAYGSSNTLSIEAWSPAELTLTGRWAPSYTGSPWAGSVGGRNLSEATNPPAVGAAVNGFTPADLDGTNDKLATSDAASTFYSASAYSMAALIFVDTFTKTDPGAAAPYDCPSVLGEATGGGPPVGGPVGSGATGVFRFGHFNGATWNSAACTLGTGAWTFIKVRYNGTNIDVGRNAEAMNSVAHGNVSTLTGALQIGPNMGSAQFVDLKALYLLTANTAISDSNFDKLRRYFNSKYALAL